MNVDRKTLAALGKIAAAAYNSQLLAQSLPNDLAKKEAEQYIKEIKNGIKKFCTNLKI